MRFLILPLAALLLGGALLAGCDASDPDLGLSPQPTVEFASGGAVFEQSSGTVEIPVRLTNPNGQPVSVQVLLAEGVSGAEGISGAAVVRDFGGTPGQRLTATVTFPGTAAETRSAVFTLDRQETAGETIPVFFALQRAENARIGSRREFELSLGISITPIAEARTLALGQRVTVEGVVTRAAGRSAYLQDATGAILTFQSAGALRTAIEAGEVRQGDRLRVTAVLGEFNQLTQLVPPPGGEFEFEVRSRNNPLPEPQTVTLAQLAASAQNRSLQARLVRVVGLTVTDALGDTAFQPARSYRVADASGSLILRTPSGIDTRITGTPIPTGTFTYVGVVGQFRGDVQLAPIERTDIRP